MKNGLTIQSQTKINSNAIQQVVLGLSVLCIHRHKNVVGRDLKCLKLSQLDRLVCISVLQH